MNLPDAAPGELPTPGLGRRLAAFLYEGVLLFGVTMGAGLVYGLATDQRHALQGQHGLQGLLFFVFGGYFTWFWSHSGQTLAMQTWHVRLLTRDGRRVGAAHAALRYLLAWMWFLPALLIVWQLGWHSRGAIAGAVVIGVLAYAGLALLHPRRQFLHDAVCGTRLVTWRAARPA